MTAITTSGTAAPERRRNPALSRLVRTEAKLFLRELIGPIWALGFPLLLLVIFGAIGTFNKPQAALGGRTELDIYLPILVAFVTAIMSLSALPGVLASYREQGVLRRMRTTPAGPARLLAAQLAVQAGFLLATAVLLVLVARYAYHVALPRQLGGFVLTELLAAAALLALGLLVAALAPSAKVAQGVGTILFFPLMFSAGLWLPLAQMPALLRHISHVTPLGAAAQALTDCAAGHWPHPAQLLTMAAWAVVFGLGAVKLFRWE